MTNTSRGTSPINGFMSPWVRMWAAQERKIKTVFSQELHWGQVKGRKQPEFREAGSHSAAAGISDKQKGKKWEKKHPSKTPHGQTEWATALPAAKWNSVSKWLLVQSFPITVILNIWVWLCWKFQRSLLQTAVVTWADGGTAVGSTWGPAHSKCTAMHDTRASGLLFNFSGYQLEKFNLKKSFTSVLICWSYVLQLKFQQHLMDLKDLAGMWELPWWSICNKTVFS